MDIGGFLLSAGFALFVVLLGWSGQITSKSKEIKEVERGFSEKVEEKYKKNYDKITNKVGTSEESLFALIDFLYSKTDQEDVEALDQIQNIKKAIPKLNKKYNFRFWIMLTTSLSFLISGIIYLILIESHIYIIITNIILIIILFFNLITSHALERSYVEDMTRLMEGL